VKITLVELEELSGNKLKVYSVIVEEDGLTLYDQFLEKNHEQHNDEISDITNRIEVMARVTGLRDDFIKTGEGAGR